MNPSRNGRLRSKEAFKLKSGKSKRRDLTFLPWVALMLLPAVLIPALFVHPQNAPEESEGISVVELLEQQDPAEVERIRRKQQKEMLRQQAEEDRRAAYLTRLEALEQGSVWEHFSDYLIMGDSRAVGFTVFQLLDPSRVMADGGLTIRDIPDYLEKVSACNPGYIYLCFGLNDAGIGYWDTAEEYAAARLRRDRRPYPKGE